MYKKRHFIFIKGGFVKKERKILHIFVHKKITSKLYIKQKPTEWKSIIIVRDFNIPFSKMTEKNRHKFSNNVENQNNTTNQLDPLRIYIPFYPIIAQYTFFSC